MNSHSKTNRPAQCDLMYIMPHVRQNGVLTDVLIHTSVFSKWLVSITSSRLRSLNIVLAAIGEIKILVYETNGSDTFSWPMCWKYHSKLQLCPTKRRRYF